MCSIHEEMEQRLPYLQLLCLHGSPPHAACNRYACTPGTFACS
jgi:hypothetical protein